MNLPPFLSGIFLPSSARLAGSSKSDLVASVLVPPGHTAFTLIPCAAVSTASALVRPVIPALEATYAERFARQF